MPTATSHKSYVLAAPDASVTEHLAGLIGFYCHMIEVEQRNLLAARSQRESARIGGAISAYRNAIEIIENSRSYDR